MTQQKILVLSSRFGEGHFQAGEALAKALSTQRSSKVMVNHLDFGAFFSKKLDYLMRIVYLNMVKKTPELWKVIYERTLDITLDQWYTIFRCMGSKRLISFIKDFQPDVIVNTHFIPTAILAEYKKRGLIDVPLVTVITDYFLHGIWVHPGVDHYIVGSKDMHAALLKMGIPKNTISLTGIPVRESFEHQFCKRQMRQALSLKEDQMTVLVMGGSSGLGGKEADVISALAKLSKENSLQLLVVCGSGQGIYHSLTQKARNGEINAKVFHYVDQIQQLMVASDFIVTKAGALTISEALKLGRPLLMYKPIPGHEHGNAVYVEKKGAGKMVSSSEELSYWLVKMLKDQKLLEEMGLAARKLLPSNSADNAAKVILSLVNTQGFELSTAE